MVDPSSGRSNQEGRAQHGESLDLIIIGVSRSDDEKSTMFGILTCRSRWTDDKTNTTEKEIRAPSYNLTFHHINFK